MGPKNNSRSFDSAEVRFAPYEHDYNRNGISKALGVHFNRNS